MRNIFLFAVACTLFATAAHAQRRPMAFGDAKYYFKGGYGGFQKLAKTDPSVNGTGLETAIADLKSGTFFALEGGLRVADNQYIGLTYSRSSETAPFRMTFNIGGGNQTITGTLQEQISYIGANYNYALPLGAKGRSAFNLKTGIGYLSYKASVSGMGQSETASAGNIGFQLGGGFEFSITKNIGLFTDLDLLGGTVTQNEEKENLTQLRYSDGLAFRF